MGISRVSLSSLPASLAEDGLYQFAVALVSQAENDPESLNLSAGDEAILKSFVESYATRYGAYDGSVTTYTTAKAQADTAKANIAPQKAEADDGRYLLWAELSRIMTQITNVNDATFASVLPALQTCGWEGQRSYVNAPVGVRQVTANVIDGNTGRTRVNWNDRDPVEDVYGTTGQPERYYVYVDGVLTASTERSECEVFLSSGAHEIGVSAVNAAGASAATHPNIDLITITV